MACESGMGHTTDVILGNLKQEIVPCLVSDDPLDVVSLCTELRLQDFPASSSSELGLQLCHYAQHKALVSPFFLQYTPSRLLIFTILFAI